MGFLTDNFGTTAGQTLWAVANFYSVSAFLRLQLLSDVGWEMNFWYYLLTYLVFDIVYTMILVPYETLVPEMTDDFKQKTKILRCAYFDGADVRHPCFVPARILWLDPFW